MPTDNEWLRLSYLAVQRTDANVAGIALKLPTAPTVTQSVRSLGAAHSGLIRAGGTILYSLSCTNLAIAPRYLQLFARNTAPQVGTVPIESYLVYPNGGFLSLGAETFMLSGIHFSSGLSWGYSVTPFAFAPGEPEHCIFTARFSQL